MLTATAMRGYNGEIEKAAILAMFLPLIISSGGNSGSQATTLVIRAMALGELRLRDWFSVVRKELLSGLSLGLVLGTIGFSGSRCGDTRISLTTASIIGSLRLLSGLRSSEWSVGHSAGQCFPSCCVVAGSTRQRHRAIRRHSGRCDRAGDLFQRGAVHSSRHAVVTKKAVIPSRADGEGPRL